MYNKDFQHILVEDNKNQFKWWNSNWNKDLWRIISLDISYELETNYWISITKKEKTILDKIIFESDDMELVKKELLAIRELWKLTEESEITIIKSMKNSKKKPSIILDEIKAFRNSKDLLDKEEIKIFEKYFLRKYGYIWSMNEVTAYKAICELKNKSEILIAKMFIDKKRPTVIIEEINNFRRKSLW